MTTVAYDLPMKDLIAELDATGHVSHRSYTKKSVTLHHNAGRLSHEGVLNVWKTRPASAHFDVDGYGKACQYVRVNEFAWAAGNTLGNQESIHIEMANSSLAPNWDVSEVTWRAAARLAGWLFAKVIKARPNASNFFVHSHWYSTACAGPCIARVWSTIMSDAQRWYDHFSGGAAPAAPAPARKSNDQIANEVIANQWGNGQDRVDRLRRAGYDANAIQALVNQKLGAKPAPTPAPARKSDDQIANEVIANQWGNGQDRINRLNRAGYNANTIQAIVNRKLGAKAPAPAVARKSNTAIAREVIAGKWGNGQDRTNRLNRAGYNASAVQAEVNRLL